MWNGQQEDIRELEECASQFLINRDSKCAEGQQEGVREEEEGPCQKDERNPKGCKETQQAIVAASSLCHCKSITAQALVSSS
jgi:hypothetical protein